MRHTCQRSVEREAVQVPQLDCFIRGGGGQLAHIGAQHALEHITCSRRQEGRWERQVKTDG